jgi:hypothetical protein
MNTSPNTFTFEHVTPKIIPIKKPSITDCNNADTVENQFLKMLESFK